MVRALRENIFTDEDQGYFNVLFFDMVKESLRQIPRADWVSKTTYLDIAQSSENDLEIAPRYFDRRDIQIKDYVNEVKPYHSKIIDINQKFTTNEDFAMAFGERMEMTVIRNVEVLTRDYFTDKPLGTPDNPTLETQAMFNPTRSGEDTVEPELPVTWDQSPLLSSAYMVTNQSAGGRTEDANMKLDPNSYSMLEISDPDRRSEFFMFKDPDTPDIEEI